MTTDTPLADAQDKRLANQSDFTSYMSMLDFARTLERDLAECRAALRELSPLVRKVLRTVDAWNLDPDKPMQHPFTDLANQARAILAKGEGK